MDNSLCTYSLNPHNKSRGKQNSQQSNRNLTILITNHAFKLKKKLHILFIEQNVLATNHAILPLLSSLQIDFLLFVFDTWLKKCNQIHFFEYLIGKKQNKTAENLLRIYMGNWKFVDFLIRINNTRKSKNLK